jgi:hypothetical protein
VITSAAADPIQWLLEPENPIIRWWTLRDLLDRPADDPDVLAARAAIPASAAVRAILAAQRRSGAWATDKHLYSPKHTATHWQLDLLADFGFTAAAEPVCRACELFFAWQLPTGAFGMFRGAKAGEPCATGRALCQFVRFGLRDDPHVQRAWAWLATTQRTDGGWHCRRAAMRPEKPSCFLGTFKVLEAYAALRAIAGADVTPDELAEETARRAAAFLHGCLLDPRMGRYASPTAWGHFVYPNFWYDTIGMVELLAGFGYGAEDDKIARAIDLILSCRRPNGTWACEGPLAFGGETSCSFGVPGEPKKWVTFRALRALKRFDSCSLIS